MCFFSRVWQKCKAENPVLRVHIESVTDVLWQESAPVASLTFTSRKAMIQPDVIMTAIEKYGPELTSLAYIGIPYFHRSKSFHDRADSPLVLLCRSCPYLESLVSECLSILP